MISVRDIWGEAACVAWGSPMVSVLWERPAGAGARYEGGAFGEISSARAGTPELEREPVKRSATNRDFMLSIVRGFPSARK